MCTVFGGAGQPGPEAADHGDDRGDEDDPRGAAERDREAEQRGTGSCCRSDGPSRRAGTAPRGSRRARRPRAARSRCGPADPPATWSTISTTHISGGHARHHDHPRTTGDSARDRSGAPGRSCGEHRIAFARCRGDCCARTAPRAPTAPFGDPAARARRAVRGLLLAHRRTPPTRRGRGGAGRRLPRRRRGPGAWRRSPRTRAGSRARRSPGPRAPTADAFGVRAGGRAARRRALGVRVDMGPDARLDVALHDACRWPRRAFGALGPGARRPVAAAVLAAGRARAPASRGQRAGRRRSTLDLDGAVALRGEELGQRRSRATGGGGTRRPSATPSVSVVVRRRPRARCRAPRSRRPRSSSALGGARARARAAASRARAWRSATARWRLRTRAPRPTRRDRRARPPAPPRTSCSCPSRRAARASRARASTSPAALDAAACGAAGGCSTRRVAARGARARPLRSARRRAARRQR